MDFPVQRQKSHTKKAHPPTQPLTTKAPCYKTTTIEKILKSIILALFFSFFKLIFKNILDKRNITIKLKKQLTK